MAEPSFSDQEVVGDFDARNTLRDWGLLNHYDHVIRVSYCRLILSGAGRANYCSPSHRGFQSGDIFSLDRGEWNGMHVCLIKFENMPRYDDRDRYGNSTRLYVGHLSSRTRSRDLDEVFSRYGRVRDVDLKHDFAFIEFSDPRDADDARYHLNGRQIDGSRIVVEFAKGGPRGSASSREYLGRGPPPGSGRCFNCGIDGHWARDCKAGDWKNKCYRCGERGHIERNCQNSPKSLKRGRSYSRSPSRSSPRRGRSRSRSFSRSRSYSRSRSPVRRERSIEREGRSRSPRYSRSPSPKPKKSPPPSKGRKRSPTPDDESPQERGSPPGNHRQEGKHEGSDYSGSPRGKSRSPSPERESPVGRRYRSPSEANGRSPSPRDDRSPMEDDGDDVRGGSPRGSDSPSSAQD